MFTSFHDGGGLRLAGQRGRRGRGKGTINPSGGGLNLSGSGNNILSFLSSNPTMATKIINNIPFISRKVMELKKSNDLMSPKEIITQTLMSLGVQVQPQDLNMILGFVKHLISNQQNIPKFMKLIQIMTLTKQMSGGAIQRIPTTLGKKCKICAFNGNRSQNMTELITKRNIFV